MSHHSYSICTHGIQSHIGILSKETHLEKNINIQGQSCSDKVEEKGCLILKDFT